MNMSLSKSQSLAYEKATSGHNVVILGQAGTGKSFVMKKIITSLKLDNKYVAVTGSTGMAASHYSQFKATTYHRWCGIRDGRYSNDELVEKIRNDDELCKIKENIMNTSVLVITEISMMSRSCFEQIEYVCRQIKDKTSVFGGIQVIAEGDFFQLPPVPSKRYRDDGQYCFKSDMWPLVFPHKIILDTVFRQNEPDLIRAVQELSLGNPSPETMDLMNELSRPLPDPDVSVKLFALNYDVDVYNAKRLDTIKTEEKTYKSTDTGKLDELEKCPFPEILLLKIGAPAVLLANLSDDLVNGRQGEVIGLEEDGPTIHFPELKLTKKITAKSWSVFDPHKNRNIATRVQVPIKVAYALTIHKCQGMTLPSVTVDASNIFKCGQLGVAVGRATTKAGLRVVNFSRNAASLKHPSTVYTFYASENLQFVADHTCCRKKTHIPYDAAPNFSDENLHDQYFDLEVDAETDELLCSISLDNIMLLDESINAVESQENLDEVSLDADLKDDIEFDQEYDDLIAAMPEVSSDEIKELTTDIDQILLSLRIDQPETPTQLQINTHLEQLNNNHTKITTFVENIEAQFKPDFEKHCKDKTATKDLSALYADFNKFMTSDYYLKECQSLFNSSELTNAQGLLCYRIASMIHSNLLRCEAHKVIDDIPVVDPKPAKTLSDGGRGKIRYIGGAAIATTRYKYMKKVKQNLYKPNKKHVVDAYHRKVKLMEKMVANEQQLREHSTDKESLEETERRQNIKGSLTNISDSCYEFFTKLNSVTWDTMTKENMLKYGEELPNFVDQTVLNDHSLYVKFANVVSKDFISSDDSDTVEDIVGDIRDTADIVNDIFEDVTKYFLKTSHNQFRKDIAKEFKRVKREAHRKSVLKKSTRKESPLTMNCIRGDVTPNKLSSHLKLKAALLTNDDVIKTKSFTKLDIRELCKAYAVPFILKNAKSELCEKLRKKILSVDAVPNPEHIQSNTPAAPGIRNELQPTLANVTSETTSGTTSANSNSHSPADTLSIDHQDDTVPLQHSIRETEHLADINTETTLKPNTTNKEMPSTSDKTQKLNKSKKKERKSRAKKRKSAEVYDEDECNCAGCGIPYPQGEKDWIACEKCEEWYHRRCGGIYDRKKWDHLQNSDAIWKCLNCR